MSRTNDPDPVPTSTPHYRGDGRPHFYGQDDLNRMRPTRLVQLLQQLQTYQLELESQNAALRKTQGELIETRDRYSELYDFAPVGYLILDADGLVVEANLTLAELVERPLTSIIEHRFSEFIVDTDREIFYTLFNSMKRILKKRLCEIRLDRDSGEPLWVQLKCVPEQDHHAGRFDSAWTGRVRAIVSDIDRHKSAEIALRRHCDNLIELIEDWRTPVKPIVILLVEDDPDDAELTQLALKQQGINENVVIARDGAEALEYFEDDAPLSGCGEDATETIVLLDVNLPKIDGFEVCNRLRALNTERPPYVIMLTVKGEKQDVVRGLEAGADDYLPKPFDPGELGARIGVGRRILALQDRMAEKVHKLQEALDDIKALGQAASSLGAIHSPGVDWDAE